MWYYEDKIKHNFIYQVLSLYYCILLLYYTDTIVLYVRILLLSMTNFRTLSHHFDFK